MVFAEELQEAQDGLHDSDDRTHLEVILGFVSCSLGALPRLVMVVRVGLPPEGGEGFPGGSRCFQELIPDLFCYLCCGFFG